MARDRDREKREKRDRDDKRDRDEHHDKRGPHSGYCFHCKRRRRIVNGHIEIVKGGRKDLIGKCDECGRGVAAFIK